MSISADCRTGKLMIETFGLKDILGTILYSTLLSTSNKLKGKFRCMAELSLLSFCRYFAASDRFICRGN